MMPVKSDREYRAAKRFDEAAEGEYMVRGYATTFNDPYILGSFDGVDYWEQVDAKAFEKTDMTDVIMQYDHSGKVYARQSNGTLQLQPDEHGLLVIADLSKSQGARELYEEIRSGLIKEMSFAFVIAEDGDEYDEKKHLRTITNIRKLYDVSAVSIPANPSTTISARSFIDGVIEAGQLEQLRRNKLLGEIRLQIEVFNHGRTEKP